MKIRLKLWLTALLLLSVGLGTLSGCKKQTSQEESGGKTVEEMLGTDTQQEERLFYNGAWYQPTEEVEAYLVMGVDRAGADVSDSDFEGGGQADMLMLLVINHQQKVYHVLQINRDTMTEVTVLGMYGDQVGTEVQQIAVAHSYGQGGKDSCQNTVQAVSKLLYGVNIDGYAAVEMGAIPLINDWAGGVTVTVKDDFSKIDPSLVQGKTITLTGEQAHNYVRGRYDVGDGTNISRMARQVEYFNGLSAQVGEMVKEDVACVAKLYQTISPYMVTDMGSGTFTKLAEKCRSYTNGGVVTLEGESKLGEEFMEFYVQEDSVKQVVFSLFYTQIQEELK